MVGVLVVPGSLMLEYEGLSSKPVWLVVAACHACNAVPFRTFQRLVCTVRFLLCSRARSWQE